MYIAVYHYIPYQLAQSSYPIYPYSFPNTQSCITTMYIILADLSLPVMHTVGVFMYICQATKHVIIHVELYCAYVLSDVSGWWKGRLKGREGLFPNNYIEKL